jgi:hypothetical protein
MGTEVVNDFHIESVVLISFMDDEGAFAEEILADPKFPSAAIVIVKVSSAWVAIDPTTVTFPALKEIEDG